MAWTIAEFVVFVSCFAYDSWALNRKPVQLWCDRIVCPEQIYIHNMWVPLVRTCIVFNYCACKSHILIMIRLFVNHYYQCWRINHRLESHGNWDMVMISITYRILICNGLPSIRLKTINELLHITHTPFILCVNPRSLCTPNRIRIMASHFIRMSAYEHCVHKIIKICLCECWRANRRNHRMLTVIVTLQQTGRKKMLGKSSPLFP